MVRKEESYKFGITGDSQGQCGRKEVAGGVFLASFLILDALLSMDGSRSLQDESSPSSQREE